MAAATDRLSVYRDALAEHSWSRLDEVVLAAGDDYVEGQPVRIRVRKREHRYTIDDDGRAVALAGKPAGWLEAAQPVVDEFWLNVNRRGVVFVAVEGRDLGWLASRVAECSRAVYGALLELDESP